MAKFIFFKLLSVACLLYCAYTACIPITMGQSKEAVSFNFTGFRDTDHGIDCVGDATVADHVVHLTNSTSSDYINKGNQTSGRFVYSRTSIQLSSIAHFSTHFQFAMNYSYAFNDSYALNYSCPLINGSYYDCGGDGIAFFLAPEGNAYSIPQFERGGWFGLMGDKLDKLPDLFAVAFDSYRGIVGTFANNFTDRQYLKSTDFPDLNKGTLWDACIDYHSPTRLLKIYLASGSHCWRFSQVPILTQSVDLSKYFTENIVLGFSSAAVNSKETHRIFSWSFNSSFYSKNSSVNFNGIENNSMKRSRKKERSITKIILSVGFGAVACIAGALLVWGYFAFIRRKRLAFIRGQILADMDLDKLSQHIPRRFNMDDLVTGTNNFSETQKLGQGGFGGVYKCILVQTNEIVAVKRISEGSRQGIKEFISEVRTASRLRHRNLVQLLGWCHERDQLLLVYEYMPNGSLDRHLFTREEEEEERPVLQWSFRYKIVREIASALLYLHEEWDQCVVHRDVKSSNVMLDCNLSAKLGDFGLARMLTHERLAQTTRAAGTLGYLAPECVASGKTSPESDVYSFGAVALEIASGKQAVDLSLLEFDMRLVVWAWDLYGQGRVLEAADMRLNGEFERVEMEQLMVAGLWCSHPDAAARPKMRQVLRLLNFEVTAPRLPPAMPVASYADTPFITGPSTSVSSSNVTGRVPTSSSQV